MSNNVSKFKIQNHFLWPIKVRLVWDADGGGKSDWIALNTSESQTLFALDFTPRPHEGTHVWLQGKGNGKTDKSGESQDLNLSFDLADWTAVFEALPRINQKFQLSFRSFERG